MEICFTNVAESNFFQILGMVPGSKSRLIVFDICFEAKPMVYANKSAITDWYWLPIIRRVIGEMRENARKCVAILTDGMDGLLISNNV